MNWEKLEQKEERNTGMNGINSIKEVWHCEWLWNEIPPILRKLKRAKQWSRSPKFHLLKLLQRIYHSSCYFFFGDDCFFPQRVPVCLSGLYCSPKATLCSEFSIVFILDKIKHSKSGHGNRALVVVQGEVFSNILQERYKNPFKQIVFHSKHIDQPICNAAIKTADRK